MNKDLFLTWLENKVKLLGKETEEVVDRGTKTEVAYVKGKADVFQMIIKASSRGEF